MTQLFGKFFRICIAIYVFMFAYQWWQPAPDLFVKADQTHAVPESGVHFLGDATFTDKSGIRKTDQHIWNQIFSTIKSAEHTIFLNLFLFNDFQGPAPETLRPLARELTDTLVAKKAGNKHVGMIVITDPQNTAHEGITSPQFEYLKKAGIFIITTDMGIFPDSNLWWSAFWRPFISWWGNSTDGGWLPHPFQQNGEKVTLRSWFAFLNFKANERNLIVADEPIIRGGKNVGQKMVTIVSSGSAADAKSADDNVALKLDDQIWQDVFQTEAFVAEYSGAGLPSYNTGVMNDATGTLNVTLLREKHIRDSVLRLLREAGRDDTVDLMLLRLSDRMVIAALSDAANRGAHIRIILDPNNKGRGIPNRPVAKELRWKTGEDIQIRWCDTHGEECSAKFMVGKTASSTFLLLGSADFTRRDIGGYNLEADVLAEKNKEFSAWKDAETYFNRFWNNTDGNFTAPYQQHEDSSLWRSPLSRMMERTGLSSF